MDGKPRIKPSCRVPSWLQLNWAFPDIFTVCYSVIFHNGKIFINNFHPLGAFMTGQERVNVFLISVIFLTGAGVILAAWDPKSTAGLEIIGFSLVLLSSILNAGKWILTELLLNENVSFQNILNNLNVSKTTQERREIWLRSFQSFNCSDHFYVSFDWSDCIWRFPLTSILLLIKWINRIRYNYSRKSLLTSLLVFVMRVADFRLVQLVSLVTFSLLGIIKEIFMILISVIFLGEILFPINIAGLIITIIGLYFITTIGSLKSNALKLWKR